MFMCSLYNRYMSLRVWHSPFDYHSSLRQPLSNAPKCSASFSSLSASARLPKPSLQFSPFFLPSDPYFHDRIMVHGPGEFASPFLLVPTSPLSAYEIQITHHLRLRLNILYMLILTHRLARALCNRDDPAVRGLDASIFRFDRCFLDIRKKYPPGSPLFWIENIGSTL